MSKIPSFTAVKIIPRDSGFLNRRFGSRGEIFYDAGSNSLRLYDSQTQGGIQLAKTDLSNVTDQSFLTKALAAGLGTGQSSMFELSISADDSTTISVQSGNTIKFVGGEGISTFSNIDGEIIINNVNNSFSSVSVIDQENVIASEINDAVNFVAGDNISITTDASTNSIIINSTVTPPIQNTFSIISVIAQDDIIADSGSDTLTLVAGEGISITTNPLTDAVTITNTISSLRFDQLSDVITATLDIDQIYLPAITMLRVSNSGASAYRFDQYGTENNPIIYAINGTTIAFKLQATGHPFLIQTSAGNNYNTGLIHVALDGTVSTEASAQGKDSGTLYWKISSTISGNYRYQCSLHAPMVGLITIKSFSTI